MKEIGQLQLNGNDILPIGIETVTNSNGTALKFPDGTMICYGEIIIDKPSINMALNNIYRTSTIVFKDFPVPFVGKLPKVFFDIQYALTPENNTTGMFLLKHPNIQNGLGQNKTLLNPGRVALASYAPIENYYTNVEVAYQAIGRWK